MSGPPTTPASGDPDVFVLRVFDAPSRPAPRTPMRTELEYVNGGRTRTPRSLLEAVEVVCGMLGAASGSHTDTDPPRPERSPRA